MFKNEPFFFWGGGGGLFVVYSPKRAVAHPGCLRSGPIRKVGGGGGGGGVCIRSETKKWEWGWGGGVESVSGPMPFFGTQKIRYR